MVLVGAITIAFLGLGLFFLFVGAIGLLRFPDFYTRLHATGKCDTLGAGLTILGLIVHHLFYYPDTILITVKLLFLILFIFIANPTATHAIMRVAYKTGVMPWKLGEGRK